MWGFNLQRFSTAHRHTGVLYNCIQKSVFRYTDADIRPAVYWTMSYKADPLLYILYCRLTVLPSPLAIGTANSCCGLMLLLQCHLLLSHLSVYITSLSPIFLLWDCCRLMTQPRGSRLQTLMATHSLLPPRSRNEFLSLFTMLNVLWLNNFLT